MCAEAARRWCEWDDTQMRAGSDRPPDPRFDDPLLRLRFARLVTHYWRHGVWLEDDELLRGADRLTGIPGVLVHGRLDLGAPLEGTWRLAQRWPAAELVVVENEGHTGGDEIFAAVYAATDRFSVS